MKQSLSIWGSFGTGCVNGEHWFWVFVTKYAIQPLVPLWGLEMKALGSDIFRYEFCCLISEQYVRRKFNYWASIIPHNLYKGMATTKINEWKGIFTNYERTVMFWLIVIKNVCFCPAASSSDIRQTAGWKGAHHWRMERWLCCVHVYTLLSWSQDIKTILLCHIVDTKEFLLYNTSLKTEVSVACYWAGVGVQLVFAQSEFNLQCCNIWRKYKWESNYFVIS